MKNRYRILVMVSLVSLLSVSAAFAGNDDRRGTAGANELLINPWARSSGWGGVNTANGIGIDALFTNVAGLTFLNKTEVMYTNTQWFGGYGGTINAFGLGQPVGQRGVLGLSVVSMSFGDIPITTVGSPEQGANGTFSPTLMNINASYAHKFSSSIRGGINVKVITESTDNVSGTGVAIDAGIQYVTGADDNIKFGIALKNVGTPMSLGGDGMSLTLVNDQNVTSTYVTRSASFEMPTCLNIGGAYDFLFDTYDQRLTVAASFTSNAFLRDDYKLGLEYSIFNIVQLRAGYTFQSGLWSSDDRVTAFTGPSAGASVAIPLMKKKREGNTNTSVPTLKIDYSYRAANPFSGSHSIGVAINL